MSAVAGTSQSLEERIDTLESRQAIARLLSEYAHGFDSRDIERFMAIWHDDAVYDLAEFGGRREGVGGIREAVHELWAASPGTHHWMVNLAIDVEEHRATAACHALAFDVDAEEHVTAVALTYEDEFERRDGRWGFVGRRVVLHRLVPVARRPT
jgi:ketosteroid isomerase-like protein